MTHLRSVATAIAVLLVATPLVAQNSRTLSDTTVIGAPAAPSSVVPSAASIDRAPSVNPTSSWTNATSIAAVKDPQRTAVRMESGSTPENKALMIVGVSGLIVGGIIGGHSGTVIMVGGTVVGLVGLWNYLK